MGKKCILNVTENNRNKYVFQGLVDDSQTKYYWKLLEKEYNQNRYSSPNTNKKGIKKKYTKNYSYPKNITPLPTQILKTKINFTKKKKKGKDTS